MDQKNATTEILVEGIPAEAVIDSGASCNIVSEQEWKKLRDQGIQCTTHSVQKKLYAYAAARPLEIVHGFTATVIVEHQQATADFIVVKGHGPILLGRETSTELQLL